jgi:hypothetical protein
MLPKILRISKMGARLGEFLIDAEKNWICHRIPHKWEGRPRVYGQITGVSSHLSSQKGPDELDDEKIVVYHDGRCLIRLEKEPL